MKKRPKSARNLLKSDEKSEEKLISKWGRIDQASQVTSQQNKKMIQEYQKRDQEDIERRLQVGGQKYRVRKYRHGESRDFFHGEILLLISLKHVIIQQIIHLIYYRPDK